MTETRVRVKVTMRQCAQYVEQIAGCRVKKTFRFCGGGFQWRHLYVHELPCHVANTVLLVSTSMLTARVSLSPMLFFYFRAFLGSRAH